MEVQQEKKSNSKEAQSLEPGEGKNTPFDKGKFGAMLEEVMAEFKQRKRHLESSLLKQPFEISGNQVRFLLSGELQVHKLMQLRPELIGIFRKKLENDFVEIEMEIREDAVKVEDKLYTSTDKLAYLTKKSPALRELQKRFGLETDF